MEDQPAADSQPTIADDTTLLSLQLGQFLELVRAEVREEMQSHQGQLAATESSATHQLTASDSETSSAAPGHTGHSSNTSSSGI